MLSADGINTVTEDGASGLFSGSLSVHIQIAKPNSFAWEIKLWKSLEMVETEKCVSYTQPGYSMLAISMCSAGPLL